MSNLGESASQIINLTADSTLADWGQTVLVDTTAGDVVVTLPSNAGKAGRMIEVKKTSSDVNTVTVEGLVLSLEDQAVSFRSDGTAAQVIQSPSASLKNWNVATVIGEVTLANGDKNILEMGAVASEIIILPDVTTIENGHEVTFLSSDAGSYTIVSFEVQGNPLFKLNARSQSVRLVWDSNSWIETNETFVAEKIGSSPSLLANKHYYADTSSAAVNKNFPAAGSEGDFITVQTDELTNPVALTASGYVVNGVAGGTVNLTTPNRTYIFRKHLDGWRGDVSSGVDFVSTKIDSNAGATTETLDASTNAGLVKLYTNIDVTNTATLAVASGETLNGATDGTFLFSNYTVGTQFRADEVTGGWVVSVVGAPSNSQLSHLLAIRSADIVIDTLDVGDAIPFNIEVSKIGSNISFDTLTGIFTLKAGGTYRLSADLAFTADGDEIEDTYQFYNVNTSSFIGARGHFKDFAGDSSPKPSNPVAVISPTIDTQIILSSTGNVDNNTGSLQEHSWMEVMEIPSSEVVLAGMVTPENLTYISAQVGTGASGTIGAAAHAKGFIDTGKYSASGMSINANGTITLVAGKRYHVAAAVRTDDSEAVAIADTLTGTTLTANINQAANTGGTVATIVEPTSDMEIAVRTVSASTYNSQSYVIVQELPSKTVVMPEALEVEDREVELAFSATMSNTSTIAIPADLSAYQGVRIELGGQPFGNFNDSAYINKADLITDKELVFYTANNGVDVVSFSVSGTGTLGTLILTGSESANTYTIRIIGIKAQKTAINTTDTPVNDQTASGYMDIGDMRMQWGRSPASDGATVTVTLPAPFASANDYAVTASLNGNSSADATRSATTDSWTATSFILRKSQISGTPVTVTDSAVEARWTAIGLKP